jgi:hypothetical protein
MQLYHNYNGYSTQHDGIVDKLFRSPMTGYGWWVWVFGNSYSSRLNLNLLMSLCGTDLGI